MGPAYVKLGQILSTRPDVVGADLSRQLKILQDRMPPFPRSVAIASVEKELNIRVDEVFSEFSEPVAAASIAQVHYARLRETDQLAPARISRWDGISDSFENRVEALKSKARLDSVYKPAAPGTLYLDEGAWDAAIAGHRVMDLQALPRGTGPGVIDAGGRIGRNFSPERQLENVSLFGALADHIKVKRQAGQVVVASYSEGARERLAGLMADEGVEGATEIAGPLAPGGAAGGRFRQPPQAGDDRTADPGAEAAARCRTEVGPAHRVPHPADAHVRRLPPVAPAG